MGRSSRKYAVIDERIDEPELPLLPRDTGMTPKFSRKRAIDAVLYNASNDPAIFSSDDPSLAVGNYTYQRAKRFHTGTW